MSNPVQPLPPSEYQKELGKAKSEGYVHRSLVGFDDFVNVLLDGSPDETISSRCARWDTEDTGLKKAIGSAVCRALNLVNKDHGAKAEAADLGRARQVVKIEEATPTVQEESK